MAESALKQESAAAKSLIKRYACRQKYPQRERQHQKPGDELFLFHRLVQRFHLEAPRPDGAFCVFVVENVHLCAACSLVPPRLRTEIIERQLALARLPSGFDLRPLEWTNNRKTQRLRLNAPVAPEIAELFNEPALRRHFLGSAAPCPYGRKTNRNCTHILFLASLSLAFLYFPARKGRYLSK